MVKMTEYCSNCGALCCGKLKIEARKGIYYPFCNECFGLLRFVKLKDIRKLLKQNKDFVIIK